MDNLKKWNEVTRGLYRYVLAANACLEIHIIYHAEDTDILTAMASLFLAGCWSSENGVYFERESLLIEQPVFECIKAAQKEINNEST